MRILIVEDEPNIAMIIKRALSEKDYICDISGNGLEAEELAFVNDYDLIILDIMLPKMNGIEICKSIRGNNKSVPVLMLTALDSYDDKIRGLDSGADDYLTKPFNTGELLARVRSLLRRSNDIKTNILRIADLELNTETRTVTRSGNFIKLSAKEFILLEYFMMNRGKLLTREKISEHVWDMHFDPKSNVIDSFVRFLRQKIDKGYSQQLIQTERGMGYRITENIAT